LSGTDFGLISLATQTHMQNSRTEPSRISGHWGQLMKNLDAMDRSILRALQENGRLTNTELADRINLSQTATAERVKRLTREGYILGYSARLRRRCSTGPCWSALRS